MIAQRWHKRKKLTGRIRFRLGRFRRPVIQVEVEVTLVRFPPKEEKTGRFIWRDATRGDTEQLIRAGVLAPDRRGES